MKVYTKGGDKGQTGIHGGMRVDKDCVRIMANGSLDELNAVIGVVRAYLPREHEWQLLLFEVQRLMMTVMSHVATPSAQRENNPNPLPDDMAAWCEGQIDGIASGLKEDGYFVLPGGTLVSAHLHFARTVARRAETQLWALNRTDALPPQIMSFVNRLSDLFFVMARYEMQQQGGMEEKWQLFTYKKKTK